MSARFHIQFLASPKYCSALVPDCPPVASIKFGGWQLIYHLYKSCTDLFLDDLRGFAVSTWVLIDLGV